MYFSDSKYIRGLTRVTYWASHRY